MNEDSQRALLRLMQEISVSMQAYLDVWPDAPVVTLLDLEDKLSPTAVIAGTRIPVMELFQAMVNGQSLPQFLAEHPELPPERAVLVLLRAGRVLEDTAI